MPFTDQGSDLPAFLRRVIRTQQAHCIIAVELTAVQIIQESRRTRRVQRQLLDELAGRNNGRVFALPGGEIAIAVPRADPDAGSALAAEVVALILHDPDIGDEAVRRRVRAFFLPNELTAFRDWVAACLPPGVDIAAPGPSDPDDQDVATLAGPLTLQTLTRIEQRISRVDIRPFVHRQTVYRRGDMPGSRWVPLIEERLIGVSDLAAKLFPDVEIAENGPMFGQLCGILDERLILHLMASRARFERPVSINLSLDTLFDPLFAGFAAHFPEDQRRRIHVEINCGEIFPDIAKATAAIGRLRGNDFGVVVDGMTLDLLPYVRVNRFDCDFLKIHLPRGDIGRMVDDACVKALRSLSRDKVVFTRCDSEGALEIGRMLDIRMYQGWFVDRMAVSLDPVP
jgi:EAL domain-containing protein (putative c-di-GMP-specific phosphodiesterase class I)